ncbi:MAG: hypothetical protein KKC20_09715, partial [Proteobacteria bacterium]|nr:hypothetical protein [Pseudomonadota bacterium]
GKIGYAFVDQAASAIRLISGQKSLENKVFHIDNPHKKSLAQVLSMALPTRSPICLLQGDALKQGLETLVESGSHDKDKDEEKHEDKEKQAAAKEYLAWINQHAIETAQGELFLSDVKMDWTLAILNRLGFSWQPITQEFAKELLERAMVLEPETPELKK